MPYFKQCGHTECAGVGGLCYKCLAKGVIPEGVIEPTPEEKRPKKKIGRPTTKTKEERMKNAEQWHINNPRAEYYLKWNRAKRGVVIGDFVISNGDKWKSNSNEPKYAWDRFAKAHVYSSKRPADKTAAKSPFDCVVMAWKSTERKTIANHKAMVLRGEM